ncbi:MAG TPA: hypothetical protein VK255_04575 [Patescibacteria group bacterium]|nr:hypothetical protein [Patescibacteria group bacterium]
MANGTEERGERRKKGFWRRLWEIFQSIGAGAGIIALQHAISEALATAGEKTGQKVGEKISKKAHEVLGLSTDDAKKSTDDEDYFGAAVNALSDPEADEINAFEARLRQDNSDRACAFVLFVARKIQKFEREEKKTEKPPKGQSGPVTVTTVKVIDDGVRQAVLFLKALLRQKVGDKADQTYNDDLTYQKRVAFLEWKNIFSLISEKKSSPASDYAKKAAEATKKFVGKNAPEIQQKVDIGASKFGNTTEKWAESIKKFRDSI